jgi:hypothetical protein
MIPLSRTRTQSSDYLSCSIGMGQLEGVPREHISTTVHAPWSEARNPYTLVYMCTCIASVYRNILQYDLIYIYNHE